MEKSVNNPAQLTPKQWEIVVRIIATVSVRLDYCTKAITDREKYSKGFLKLPSSKINLARLYVRLNAIPRSNTANPRSNTFFPDDLNQQLAKAFAKDSKRFLQIPVLSRILKESKSEKILLNTIGKEKIKDDIGNLPIKEHKRSKRGGRYSAYKITPDVQNWLDVLGNPVALETIHNSLKSSALLTKFLKLIFKNLTYILSTHDEKTQKSIMQGFDTTRPLRPVDSNINYSDLQEIRTMMGKVGKKEIECLASEFANHMMKENNLLKLLYLLLAFPTEL